MTTPSVMVIKHGKGRLAVAVLHVLGLLKELAKDMESNRMARHSTQYTSTNL